MRKKNIKMVAYAVLFVIFFVYLYFFVSSQHYDDENKVNEIPAINNQEIIIDKPDYKEEINKLKVDYNNNDIVGILSIENTDFNEIVVQTIDNDYYLEHSLNKQYDWRGQTFLDYRVDINNSKKLLIYGHNSGNYNLPFKIFENYYDSSYVNEHKYMYLQTDEEVKIFEIFAIYVEVSDWSYFSKINFSSDDEYYNHILELKNKSLYDTGVVLNKNDEILIIQTCSYHSNYANYENKFLLVMGKLIDEI